jgi:hypothetical protein
MIQSRTVAVLSIITATCFGLAASGCAGDANMLADDNSTTSDWVRTDAANGVVDSAASPLVAGDTGDRNSTYDAAIPEIGEGDEDTETDQDSDTGAETEPQCEPLGDATVVVETSCTWGACPGTATVVVVADGVALNSGLAGEPVLVPAGCFFDLQVTLNGLADAPTYSYSDVIITESDSELTLPLHVETALLRAEVHHDGRNVAAVVQLHRYADDYAGPDAETCGTLGATGDSVEISAGRYLVEVFAVGQATTEITEINGGDVKRISVDID